MYYAASAANDRGLYAQSVSSMHYPHHHNNTINTTGSMHSGG